jgi:hypothetical protein
VEFGGLPFGLSRTHRLKKLLQDGVKPPDFCAGRAEVFLKWSLIAFGKVGDAALKKLEVK